jgi:hypothetical protein
MVKKSNGTKVEVKFCPRCNSNNIGVDSAWEGVNEYCLDCGYNSRKEGPFKVTLFPTKSKMVKAK